MEKELKETSKKYEELMKSGMKNWQKNLKDEFGMHFKESGELQFLEAFIEDLLSYEKEKWQEKLIEEVRVVEKDFYAYSDPTDLKQLSGFLAQLKKLLKQK